MSTMTLARPGFQDKVERPVPRPFCKWWAEGRRDLALAAETERKGWYPVQPLFFVLSPQTETGKTGTRKTSESHSPTV